MKILVGDTGLIGTTLKEKYNLTLPITPKTYRHSTIMNIKMQHCICRVCQRLSGW